MNLHAAATVCILDEVSFVCLYTREHGSAIKSQTYLLLYMLRRTLPSRAWV